MKSSTDSVRFFCSVGGNLPGTLDAFRLLHARLEDIFHDLVCSMLYVARPQDEINQPDFFNWVFSATTMLSPNGLHEFCLKMEHELGRVKSYPKGPRLIDIDILLYGDFVIQSCALTIPHPRMKQRAFVLVPLSEIAPDIHDPQTKKMFTDYVCEVEDQGIYPTGFYPYNA